MKKVSLSFLFALSVFIFGCQKEKEIQPAASTENTAGIQQAARVFKVADWSQLPENLKNAERISADADSKTSKINAVYKYPIGPWGGTTGGTPYSFYPLNANDKIYAVGGRGTTSVEGLVVWYITPAGTLYYYAAGATTGLTVYNFYSNTYIYALGGIAGTVVNKLTFYIQTSTFSDSFYFGASGTDVYFWNVVANEQVLGFFGRAGTSTIIQAGGYVYSRP